MQTGWDISLNQKTWTGVLKNKTKTIRYTSGCIPSQRCSSANTCNPCIQWCSKRYCKQAGCGDSGFEHRIKHGLLYLDCSNTGNSDDCDTVKLCASDQACHIGEHAWGEINDCTNWNVKANLHVPLDSAALCHYVRLAMTITFETTDKTAFIT